MNVADRLRDMGVPVTSPKESQRGSFMLDMIKNNRDGSTHSFRPPDYLDTNEYAGYVNKASDKIITNCSNDEIQNDNDPQISSYRCSVIVTNPLRQPPNLYHEEEQHSPDQQTSHPPPNHISYQQQYFAPHSKLISRQHYYKNLIAESTNCDIQDKHLYSDPPCDDLEHLSQHYCQVRDIATKAEYGYYQRHYMVNDHQYDNQDQKHAIQDRKNDIQDHQDKHYDIQNQHCNLEDQQQDFLQKQHLIKHPSNSQEEEIDQERSPQFLSSQLQLLTEQHQPHPQQHLTNYNHQQDEEYPPLHYCSQSQQEPCLPSQHQNEQQLELHKPLHKEDQQKTLMNLLQQKQLNDRPQNKIIKEYENSAKLPIAKCPLCERCYKHKSNLSAHIREFHQQRRKHCPFCTKTFSRHNQKRKHIETKHYDMVTKRFPTSVNENSSPYTESSKAKESFQVLQSSFRVANELKYNRQQGSPRRYREIQSENLDGRCEDVKTMADNTEWTDDEDNKLEIITDEDENNEGAMKWRTR